MTIKLAAFDVHQTLAFWPSSRVHSIEVQQLLDRYGIPTSYQVLDAARTAVFAFDAPKREITCYVDFLALQFHRAELKVPLDLIESVAAKYESRDVMELFPDAIATLEKARAAGLKTCAYTTLPPFMLGDVGKKLLPLFDAYLNNTAIGLAKGDRRFYERVQERLGVEPAEILCVGDDPIGDCMVPAEAGWRPLLLDRHNRHSKTDAGQIGVVESLDQLASYY